MPLVVFCGFPSSGKSTWVERLAKYLRDECAKEVIIVKEEEFLKEEKNSVLDDSRKEKELRAKVKSAAQRVLTKNNVVIIDALNYIKGYRYELYCMSKAIPTRQVTVLCDISEEMAWTWNSDRPTDQQYTKEVFDHLIQRFEAPEPQNRWDAPLFSVLPNEDLDMQRIFQSLYFNKPPKPNQSTKNKPVSESNFLAVLEKVTSEIIQVILSLQNSGPTDYPTEIKTSYSTQSIKLQSFISLTELTKLKRQFITMTKNSNVKGEPGDLFVQYLNSQFKAS